MKRTIELLAVALAFTGSASALDDVKLQPNQVLRFEFPDLPDTLATMESGRRAPARLTAQLPDNYSPDGVFPIFVFLSGGAGGRGDTLFLDRGKTIGSRDFIMVNLPLFKRAYQPENNPGITIDDFEVVSRCYRTMLGRLFDAVTNTTAERSAFGGFSNGAHAAALLVAGQDDFILRHFRAFYFVEGGYSLVVNALGKPALKSRRFLWMRGAHHNPAKDGYARVLVAIEQIAEEANLNFTSVVMLDTGHAFPPKHQEMLGQWVRKAAVNSP
jgi:hypothetical protein